jgi:predicted DNA-binding transcriptional regulator YafY
MPHKTSPDLPYTREDCAVLTAAEIAELLGVHKLTLLRMRQREDAGGLPFVMLSEHRVGYLWRDVRAFLAARRVGKVLEAA